VIGCTRMGREHARELARMARAGHAAQLQARDYQATVKGWDRQGRDA